jgi:hypothetical protein
MDDGQRGAEFVAGIGDESALQLESSPKRTHRAKADDPTGRRCSRNTYNSGKQEHNSQPVFFGFLLRTIEETDYASSVRVDCVGFVLDVANGQATFPDGKRAHVKVGHSRRSSATGLLTARCRASDQDDPDRRIPEVVNR